MEPPALQESDRGRSCGDGDSTRRWGFRNAKNISGARLSKWPGSSRSGTAGGPYPPLTCVLLDRHPVVHLVDPEDLRLAAVAAKFVILAHDQRLDRLGRTDLRAETAEAAAREVEVEVVEDLDFRPRLAMAAERDQIVRARLGALIADDARLRAGAGLGLQAQDPAKTGRRRPPLGRVLEGEGGLRRVLE